MTSSVCIGLPCDDAAKNLTNEYHGITTVCFLDKVKHVLKIYFDTFLHIYHGTTKNIMILVQKH